MPSNLPLRPGLSGLWLLMFGKFGTIVGSYNCEMKSTKHTMLIGDATIAKAIDLLCKAAKPKKIIMFGSYARRQADPGSDLDLLVVEESVSDTAAEMVRLMRVLSPLRIPADVLVVSDDDFAKWNDTPGHVLFEAATQGKVLYDAA